MSNAIEEIRKAIDEVDAQFVQLLAERKDLVLSVAEEKKEAKLPKFDYEREAELIEKRREHAKELGLDEDVVEKLFKVILDYSREFLNNLPDADHKEEPKKESEQ